MTIPHCEMKNYNGSPTIHVEGKPISSVAYFCTIPTEARISSMKRAGVNLITWGIGGASAHNADIGWRGPDLYDNTHLDKAAHIILEHHPNAWIMPRVATMAPNWWLRAHPDHNAIMSTGLAKGPGTGMGPDWCDDPRETSVSQASDLWQQGCEIALQKMIEHIDASDWGHRCIGLQPNGGVNEWFVSHAHSWHDYSPMALNAFRHYLAENNYDGAEEAEIPMPEELQQGSWGNWHDPAVDRRCELWWRFYHGLNARRMMETCDAIKRASGQRLITGAFYGYVGDSYHNSEPAGWLYGHHHNLREVATHPAVDFLAAPFSYLNRQPGGTPENQIPTASCDLAECFTFTENDMGTFWAAKDESESTIRNNHNTMVRDQGQRIIRRQGFWWMDLLHTTSDWPSDWYTHPYLEELILKLTTLQNKEAAQVPSQWKPQIAVVLGNDSPFYAVPGYPNLAEWVTYMLRHVIPAIGAPFDVIMLDDLALDHLPDYRLFIFLDVPCVSEKQREMVHQVLSKQKAVAYFQGLPGLINQEKLDPAHCSQLTGMQLKLLQGKPMPGGRRRVTARFSNFDHPFTADVPPSHTLGFTPSDAIFFVDDAEATSLAALSAKGRTGVAMKNIEGGWVSVFSSFAGAPPVFFRNLAKAAGVHVFTDQDAMVDACDNLLLIHKIGPAPVNVQLHQSWTEVVDQISGKSWSAKNGQIRLEGVHGESYMLGKQ